MKHDGLEKKSRSSMEGSRNSKLKEKMETGQAKGTHKAEEEVKKKKHRRLVLLKLGGGLGRLK